MAAVPATVVALLSTVTQLGPLPPNPIAWAETPLAWTIILEDGRKLRFEKVPPSEPQASIGDFGDTSRRRQEPAKPAKKARSKYVSPSVPHIP